MQITNHGKVPLPPFSPILRDAIGMTYLAKANIDFEIYFFIVLTLIKPIKIPTTLIQKKNCQIANYQVSNLIGNNKRAYFPPLPFSLPLPLQ